MTSDAVRSFWGLPLARGNRLWMLQAALIVLAGWYVFSPALHGDWLWDDHEIRDNPTLHQGLGGLEKIWVAPAATDYYPVEATVLWAEWHLWRDQVAGYHLTNIGLHLLGAFLLWRQLKRMGVRFAWLAGLLFVVHPLAVESVVWISEIKNALSLPLLLMAIGFWMDYDGKIGPRQVGAHLCYLGSLVCFLAALLSKSSVIMLPVILLLHAWWRRGRIGWADLRAAAPFFAMALIVGLVTLHFQSARAIGDWRTPDEGLLSRIGGAGLAIGFYFWKCVFPLNVMPIYPGWSVSTTSLVAFLPWLVLGALFVWLVHQTRAARRSAGRDGGAASALFGLGWFVLFLLPVLGFLPMAYQHIAPVGDQLVYLSLVGIAGLAVAGLGAFNFEQEDEEDREDRKDRKESEDRKQNLPGLPDLPVQKVLVFSLVISVVVVALAVKSHRYAGVFVSQETMWAYNAAHNSRTSFVYSNLGFVLNRDGQFEEAISSYEKAIQLDPEDAEAEDELAGVLVDRNRIDEAMPHYERAIILYESELQKDPSLRGVNNKLGLDLAKVGRMAEAVDQFEQAAQRNPDSYEVHNNLAKVLVSTPGRLPEAISQFEQAARLNPDSAMIQNNLGYALIAAGRPAEAVARCEQALRIDANYAGAHTNLGFALAQLGRFSEARGQFEEALRLNPNDADARSNLARLPPPPSGP